jgi:hypothetical protein
MLVFVSRSGISRGFSEHPVLHVTHKFIRNPPHVSVISIQIYSILMLVYTSLLLSIFVTVFSMIRPLQEFHHISVLHLISYIGPIYVIL